MTIRMIWVGAAMSLATTVIAQQADTSIGKPLDDVIITANKTFQKQSQTGKVVAVIDKQTISNNPGKNIAQLLQQQAGVTINGALNNLGTNQSVYLRGSATGRTLILIDGVPAYDPSNSNSEFDLNLINLQQVERIEIAKGAQSTLYGSDAIGGVINIITVPKSNTPVQADVSASFGSFNTLKANAQLSGQTEKLHYAFRYAKVKSRGFSSAYDNAGHGDFDDDGYNGDHARAELGYRVTPSLTAKTYIQYNKYKADIDDGAFVDDRDLTSGSKNLMTGAQFKYQRNNWTLTGNYFYNHTERNLLNDSFHVPGFTQFLQNDYDGIAQFAELYTNISIGKGFSLLAGTDFRYANTNNYLLSVSSFGPYEEVQSQISAKQYSGYGSFMYNSKRLNAEAGFRFNNHSQYGNNITFTFNPSFNLDDHWRLFGSIASAFKTPSLYQLYSAYGNKNLQPEESMNYETGVQQSHGNFSNRLVFFHRDIDNGLDFDYINYAFFNFNNQKVKGIEWETNWKPVNKLSISANYTFLDPQETSQSRESTNDTTYNYLLRRPQHQANMAIQWTATNKLRAGIDGRMVSKRYDVGGYQSPDVKLDGYFLLGANLSYQFNKNVGTYIQAQNLLNTDFYDIYGYNSMPVNVQAGIKLHL